MIRFEIYTADGRTDRVFRCRDGRFGDELFYEMYDHLTRRFDLAHEQAEDAACWCELAAIGEEYEADEFTIIVSED